MDKIDELLDRITKDVEENTVESREIPRAAPTHAFARAPVYIDDRSPSPVDRHPFNDPNFEFQPVNLDNIHLSIRKPRFYERDIRLHEKRGIRTLKKCMEIENFTPPDDPQARWVYIVSAVEERIFFADWMMSPPEAVACAWALSLRVVNQLGNAQITGRGLKNEAYLISIHPETYETDLLIVQQLTQYEIEKRVRNDKRLGIATICTTSIATLILGTDILIGNFESFDILLLGACCIFYHIGYEMIDVKKPKRRI